MNASLPQPPGMSGSPFRPNLIFHEPRTLGGRRRSLPSNRPSSPMLAPALTAPDAPHLHSEPIRYFIGPNPEKWVNKSMLNSLYLYHMGGSSYRNSSLSRSAGARGRCRRLLNIFGARHVSDRIGSRIESSPSLRQRPRSPKTPPIRASLYRQPTTTDALSDPGSSSAIRSKPCDTDVIDENHAGEASDERHVSMRSLPDSKLDTNIHNWEKQSSARTLELQPSETLSGLHITMPETSMQPSQDESAGQESNQEETRKVNRERLGKRPDVHSSVTVDAMLCPSVKRPQSTVSDIQGTVQFPGDGMEVSAQDSIVPNLPHTSNLSSSFMGRAGAAPVRMMAGASLNSMSPKTALVRKQGLQCYVLLRVYKANAHDVPTLYHEGVSTLRKMKHIRWHEVLAVLDETHHLYFYNDERSKKKPVHNVILVDKPVHLNFFSPLDGSLTLTVHRDISLVEIYVLAFKSKEDIEIWYETLSYYTKQCIPYLSMNSTATRNISNRAKDRVETESVTLNPVEPNCLDATDSVIQDNEQISSNTTPLAETLMPVPGNAAASETSGAPNQLERELINVVIHVPDLGTRLCVAVDAKHSCTANVLRTHVLNVLMGRPIFAWEHSSTQGMIQLHQGDTPEQAMQRRVRLVNIWRWWRSAQVGLAWRRWNRLEWLQAHELISLARIKERTHTLELRRALHYGVETCVWKNVPVSPGRTQQILQPYRLSPPPDVEGCLIRLINNKKSVSELIKRQAVQARRLYLATRGRFLFITTSSRLPPPQFEETGHQRRACGHSVRRMTPFKPPSSFDKAMQSRYGTSPLDASAFIVRKAVAMLDLTELVRVETGRVTTSPVPDRLEPASGNDRTASRSPNHDEMPTMFASNTTPIPTTANHLPDTDARSVQSQPTRPSLEATSPAEAAVPYDSRRVDLVMRNGQIIRLKAWDRSCAREWKHRLEALASFWREHKEAERVWRRDDAVMMGAFSNCVVPSHFDLQTHKAQQHAEQVVRRIGEKSDYEDSIMSADSRLWPVCVSLGCTPIVYSGRLYRKVKPRRPARQFYCLLTRDGYLCYFDSDTRMMKPVASNEITYFRAQMARGQTFLYNAYVCSRTSDETRSQTQDAPMSRYIGDGLYSNASLVDCSFTVWLPNKRRHFWQKSGRCGRSIVFQALDHTQAEAWITAMKSVIHRLRSQDVDEDEPTDILFEEAEEASTSSQQPTH